MEIKNHLIQGDNIIHKKSPSFGGQFARGDLDTVVIHYTGGPASAAINTFCNPRIRVSSHLVIGQDGIITQLVPFDRVAWHAGKSSHMGRIGMNQYSIGVELENAGLLTKSGNIYRTWYGSAYGPDEVIEATHRNQSVPRFWQTYTELQMKRIMEVGRLLVDTYSLKYILGHEEISPRRKLDPGPAFPLDKLRNSVLYGDRDIDEEEELPEGGRVIVENLNIREMPDISGTKITKPIPKGTPVKIVGENNGWYKIVTQVEGWVLGKFIDSE